MTDDILQLTGWLKEVGCAMAAMESTGSYWKPVYNIFEEEQVPVIVVNAQHIKTASMNKQLQLLEEIPGIGKKVQNGCLRK